MSFIVDKEREEFVKNEMSPLLHGEITGVGFSKGYPVLLVSVTKKKKTRTFAVYFSMDEERNGPGYPFIEETTVGIKKQREDNIFEVPI